MANRFLSNITINDAYTFPSADGDNGQVISTDGAGNLSFVDQTTEALTLNVTVKNVSGGSLAKGTIVHAHPSATPPSGNVVEVIAADYDDAAKMPAIGILNETLANEAEGQAIMFGTVSSIDTSSFSAGDELWVGDNGAFTNTKPATAGQLIQKIAVVIKSHASNGLIKIFGAGRTNDVPLPLYIDNTNQRVGIRTDNPSSTLDVVGQITSKDIVIDFNTGTLSHGVIFRGVADSAGEVGIRANGEAFEIYEPEQSNRVWLSIEDDPQGNGIAAQLNSPSGFTPILTNYNKGDYITKSYIDGLNVDADTFDGLNSTEFLRSNTADTFSGGTLTISSTAPILDFVDTNSFTDTNDRFRIRAAGDVGQIRWYDDSAATDTVLTTFYPNGNVSIAGELSLGGAVINMANNDGFVYDDANNVMKVKYDGNQYDILTAANHTSFTDPKYLRSDADDTTSGSLTIEGGNVNIIDDAGNQPKLTFRESPITLDANVILEYDGSGSGEGNYFAMYSDVTGWATKGSGFNFVPANGRVGIGTSTPDSKLDITASGAHGLVLNRDEADAANSSRLFFLSSNGNIGLFANAGRLDFRTGSTPGSTSGNRKMTLTQAGDLMIGTSGSPDSMLHILANTTNNQFILERTGTATGKYKIYTNNNSLWFYDQAQTAHRMMINEIGQVGIGTTSPNAKLHVEDSVNGEAVLLRLNNAFDDNDAASNPITTIWMNAASNNGYLKLYGAPADTASKHRFDIGSTAGSSFLTFSPGSTERMRITYEGDTGIGTIDPETKLHIREDLNSPVLLTLHNHVGDILNDGSTGNFIDFKSTDNNATYTPQVRIGMYVQDYSGDGGQLSEGVGNFVVYTGQGTDSAGNGTLRESFKVREDNTAEIIGDGAGATLRLVNTDTSVFTDDLIGSIEFYNNDADGAHVSSFIKALGEETYGRKGSLVFGTAVTNSTDAVEAMRINESGNVGINIDTPDDKLDVDGRIRARQGFAGTDGSAKEYFWYSNNTGNSGTIWRKIGTYNSAGQSSRIMITAVGTASYGGGQSSGKTTIVAQVNNNNLLEGSWWQEVMATQYNAVGFVSTSNSNHDIYFQVPSYSEYAFEAIISDGTFTPDATTVTPPTFTRQPTREWNVNAYLWVVGGDVGIGDSSPSEKLDVAGKIRTTGRNYVYAQENHHIELVEDTGSTYLGNVNQSAYISNGSYYGAQIYNINTTQTGLATIYLSEAGDTYFLNDSFPAPQTNNIKQATYRMVVKSDGNVGINCTDPQTNLEIRGNSPYLTISNLEETDAGIYFTDYQAGAVPSSNTQAAAIKFNSSDNKLRFLNNDAGAARMTVDINGHVGIGTETPSQRLHVEDNVNGAVGLRIHNVSAGTAATARLSIDTTGNNFSIISYPDADTANANRTDIGSTAGGSYLTFSPASAERIRIQADGLYTANDASSYVIRSYHDDGSYTQLRGYGIEFGRTAAYLRPNLSSSTMFFGDTSNNWNEVRHYSSEHNWYTGNSFQMRLRANGCLGVGMSSPDFKVDIQDDSPLRIHTDTNGVGAKIRFSDHESGNYTQNGTMEYVHSDTQSYGSGNAFKFYGTEASMSFHVAGKGLFTNDVIAYYSDMRLKTKIGDIQDPISKVQALNGFYYEPNEIAQSYGYEKERRIGLSAQEVQEVVPEAVTMAAIGDDYLSVDYAKLIPVLVEAIKEQQKQIDELKAIIKNK